MRGIFLAVSLAVVGPVATAAITDGTSTFDYTEAIPGSTGPAIGRGQVNWNPFGGTDQAFQIWWWIRGPGDSGELAFPAVTSQSEVGNVNTLTWGALGTAAGPVSATAVYTLTETGGTNNIGIDLTLAYSGTDPVVYDVFLYVDLDLNGTASLDSASGDINGVTVTEGANAFVLSMTGADAFQVEAYSGLRAALADGSITNLNNSGVPFGPGDFTMAFQKSVTFGGAGKGTVSADIGVGPQDELLPEVPEPTTWLLTGLGVVALDFARRRTQR